MNEGVVERHRMGHHDGRCPESAEPVPIIFHRLRGGYRIFATGGPSIRILIPELHHLRVLSRPREEFKVPLEGSDDRLIGPEGDGRKAEHRILARARSVCFNICSNINFFHIHSFGS